MFSFYQVAGVIFNVGIILQNSKCCGIKAGWGRFILIVNGLNREKILGKVTFAIFFFFDKINRNDFFFFFYPYILCK